jgi:hypothetical protein
VDELARFIRTRSRAREARRAPRSIEQSTRTSRLMAVPAFAQAAGGAAS